MTEDNELLARRYFGGSPQSTEQNLDYFIKHLRAYNASNKKMTFRQWIQTMMTLMDVID